ncbi:hypothetical protein [Nocardia sp. NBC_01327]|uniref:hypothetical protein n=1 Tax=Nocardia sp. NBC_01327 TaxID=2903593 RepID=UPI002E13CA74|nr:hypothetical protein OG326_10165 [Nocardia sp. NBC_01327]
MAYLSTDARAASNGKNGIGGHGSLNTHWHNMPDAKVELLSESDIRGDIEIRWKIASFEGVLADLTVSEARTLRDNLTAAITEFEESNHSGIDNEVEDQDSINDDGSSPAPAWVRDAQKYGLPSPFERVAAQENQSATRGPEGVA